MIQSTVAATVAATGSGNGTLDFVNGREGTVLSVLGIGIKNIPNLIAVIVNDLIFATIGIGLITMLVKYRRVLKGKTKNLYQEIRLLDSKLVLGSVLILFITGHVSITAICIVLLRFGPFILPAFNLHSSNLHYRGH